MKLAVVVLVCFLSALVSAEIPVEFEYDWSDLKPRDLFVDPIGPPVSSGQIKIIGGREASRNQFPYQAALVINNANFCGGSIISKTVILTAAHCVYTASSMQIIVGAHNPRTTTNEPTQVRIAATFKASHVQWNPRTLANDIAVVRAASIPVGSTGISAIPLANWGSFDGSTAVISGWGKTSDGSNALSTKLRFLQVSVISNAVCARSFGSIVQPQHICISGAGGRGTCSGDSGGPLARNGVLIGIVSFGARRCQAGYPSVFTRVSHYRPWIRRMAGV